MTPCQAACCN